MCIFNSAWNWLSINASNVIAICALGLTIWQAHMSRSHNKLCVQPHLALFFDNSSGGREFHLTLQNNGVGPALISKFCINIDGREIQKVSPEEKLDIVKKKLFPTFECSLVCCDLGDKDYMMSVGEKLTVLRFVFNDSKSPSINNVDDARNRIQIQIDYESIYKEKRYLNE